MINISYGITVCNEEDELTVLLELLIPFIDTTDEIIILVDKLNTTQGVIDIIESYKTSQFKVVYAELNNDFASFKNLLIDNATKDYLFQLDADEFPNFVLLENLKELLELNSNVDVLYVPRVNRVAGITKKHLDTWGWKIDNFDRINFPDYQMRILKLSNKDIRWENKVHEVLTGYKVVSALPIEDEAYCLYHYKHITKQELQNQFYSKLS